MYGMMMKLRSQYAEDGDDDASAASRQISHDQVSVEKLGINEFTEIAPPTGSENAKSEHDSASKLKIS